MGDRPLSIPVILGTVRKGRLSGHAARFVRERIAMRPGIVSELIDIAELDMTFDDAGESAKNPQFSAAVSAADALVIVAPEYNHSFPGLLKHALDSNLEEYIHKAVGIASVSAGPFGGTRAVQSFLPVMRELGLVTIFHDINFGSVQNVFDETGALLDPAYERRADKFIDELVWMARTLRHGRETTIISIRDDAPIARTDMKCAECGAETNRHAVKLRDARSRKELDEIDPHLGGILIHCHTCPECGRSQSS